MELNSPIKYLNENQTVSLSCEDICHEIDNIFSRLLDYDGRHIKATIQKLSDDHRELTKTDLFWSIALYECKGGRFVIGFYYNYEHATEKNTITTRFVDSYGNFYTTQNAFLWNLLVKECWLYNLPQRIISVNEEDFETCLKEGFFQFFETPGEALLNVFIQKFSNDFKCKLLQLKAIYPFFQKLLTVPGVSFNKGEQFQIEINGNAFDIGNIENYETLEDILKTNSNTNLSAYTKYWEEMLDEMSKIKKISGWMNESERAAFGNKKKSSTVGHYIKQMNATFGKNQIFAYGCHKIAYSLLRTEYINNNKNSINILQLKQLMYWIKYKSSLVYLEDKRAIVNNDNNITNYADQFDCLLKEVQKCQTSHTYRFVSNHAAAYHANRHFDELKMCYKVFKTQNFLTELEMIELLKDLVDTSQNLQSESMEPTVDITKYTKLTDCLQFYLKVIPDFIFLESLYTGTWEINGYCKNDNKYNNTFAYTAGNHIFGVKQKKKNNVITMYRK